MNILFITLSDIKDINTSGIYQDLLRAFIKKGHDVYVVSPAERKTKQATKLMEGNGCVILKVKTGNIQKTNLLEKGISTVLLEPQLIRAIDKYFNEVKFDLILYSTPPVTIAGVVRHVKKRNKAVTYLMLKDIFPQNAVDLKMIKKGGFIYKYFRKKEKDLYEISNYIGCTSPENINYIKKNNPDIPENKMEICVNCKEPYGKILDEDEIRELRNQYGLPLDKTVFVYGGNLGKPQGIDFLEQCLYKTKDLENAYFLIVGAGTEQKKLKDYISNHGFENVKMMDFLPKAEFDKLTAACDVGMIFLDFATTTPNTPSRLLAYTDAGIPVLAVTDPCTDVGKIIEDGKFGWHCLSNDVEAYYKLILKILNTTNWTKLKENSHNYLLNNYTPEHAFKSIIQHIEEK
jgi:glycosyltransferase involved in cell wall biosynthesis